jgi:hypothetical protein
MKKKNTRWQSVRGGGFWQEAGTIAERGREALHLSDDDLSFRVARKKR